MLECLTRELPWKGVVADADGANALVLAVTAGERPPVPENVPRDLAALARACWAHEPGSRPTLELVLSDFQAAGGVFKGVGGGGRRNVAVPPSDATGSGGGGGSGGGNVKALAGTPDGSSAAEETRAIRSVVPRVATTGFPPIPSTPRRRSARQAPRQAPDTPTGQRTASPDTVLSGEVVAPRTAAAPSPPAVDHPGSDSSGKGAKESRDGVLSLIEHLQCAMGDTVGRLSSGESSPCTPSPPEMGALTKR